MNEAVGALMQTTVDTSRSKGWGKGTSFEVGQSATSPCTTVVLDPPPSRFRAYTAPSLTISSASSASVRPWGPPTNDGRYHPVTSRR